MSFNVRVADADEKYSPPEVIEQRIKSLEEHKPENKLPTQWLSVCKGNATGSNNHVVECVTLFEDARVQHASGEELAKQYIKVQLYKDTKNILDIKLPIWCSPNIRKSNGKSYLQCITDYNNKRYFYEFKFDTLDSNIDSHIEEDIFKHVCLIAEKQNPNYYYTAANIKTCNRRDGIAFCVQIEDFLQSFGYTVDQDNRGCYLHSGTKVKEESLRNQIKDSIKNTEVFRGFQMKFTPNVKYLVEHYVRSKLNSDDLSRFGATKFSDLEFDCLSAARHTSQQGGDLLGFIPVNGTSDDVLSCHIKDRTIACPDTPDKCWKWIDFVFDDLSENWDSYDKEANAGLNCYAQNGTYNNAQCHGLGEAECNAVSKELEKQGYGSGRAKFNSEIKICELKDAKSAQAIKNGLKIASTSGEIAIVAVATVGTGGGFVLVGAAIGLGATVVSSGISAYQNIKANDIVEQAGHCVQETDKNTKHECASKLISIMTGKDFDNWDLDQTTISALGDMLPKLIDSLDVTKLADITSDCDSADKDCINYYIQDQKGKDDTSVAIKTIADVVAFISIVGAGVKGGYKLAKGGRNTFTRIANVDKNGETLTKTQKLLEEMKKVIEPTKNKVKGFFTGSGKAGSGLKKVKTFVNATGRKTINTSNTISDLQGAINTKDNIAQGVDNLGVRAKEVEDQYDKKRQNMSETEKKAMDELELLDSIYGG